MALTYIRFLRRAHVVEYCIDNPMQTVLDYLRLEERSLGTKEGCNEGDCGACTVVLGRLRNNKLVYEPVNACILLMGHLHGCELITVDDLAHGNVLHPVQRAMVDHHGSQCGFCTPGIVMSLFALYHHKSKPTRQQILDQLAGNLCRCTGYRPIIAAAEEVCIGEPGDAWDKLADDIVSHLRQLNDGRDVLCTSETGLAAVPCSEASVLKLAQEHPDATIVAGATDIGLWITKHLRSLPKLIHVHGVEALHTVTDRATTISIGAAATYAEAETVLATLSPDLSEVMRRIGSKQVRSTGTIGGNIANGSPIGDMPPMLIALGARLVLKSSEKQRDLALEQYFIDYGKQDRAAGELVWRIDIPKLQRNEHFFAHKISKRFDQDISAVLAAAKLTIENGIVAKARIAYGGMAATPKRAAKTERALEGLRLDATEFWDSAIDWLSEDFQPISDMRASASYRMTVAKNLLKKFLAEAGGQQRSSLRVLEFDAQEAVP